MENLIAGEDGGEAFRAFSAGEENGFDFLVQDLAVKKEEGAERLILGRGGYISILSQVSQEGLDLGGAHLCGMALVVEEDEAARPVHVSLFGAVGVVFDAQGFAELVEEFFSHEVL